MITRDQRNVQAVLRILSDESEQNMINTWGELLKVATIRSLDTSFE